METTNETQNCRYTDEATKNKYVVKLLHPVKTNGFQGLRMDDIAKAMDLSKATLYKYFPSRDEIIERLTALYIKYLVCDEAQLLEGSPEAYIKGFQSTFSQTLLIANYGTEPFFQDLREVYPQFLASIEVAISDRNGRLRAFYERGIAEGYMNDLNAMLYILQDELIFQKLLDPHYLMRNNLTLRNAIWDYYQIKKQQLFKADVLSQINDEAMSEKVDYLVRKITFGVS